MHTTLAPWTGDPIAMPDVASPPAAPPPIGRTRRWSIEIGRGGFAICSTVEDHRPRIVAPVGARSTAALTVAAVAGGLALLLVGASAGRAWSPPAVPAETAMIVPAARPAAMPTAPFRAKAAPRPVAGRIFPTVEPTTAEDVPPAPTALPRAEAIARALRTGEFQEWAAGDGTTGFAVAGPAEATAAGRCRALAVLTRRIDGSDSVASSRECAPPSAGD